MEKDLASFDLARLPAKVAQQVRTLLDGSFIDRRENLLLFGKTGAGKSGVIRDLRIGMVVSWRAGDAGREGPLAQEFDVCFTDGKRLFIVECKAGSVLSEDIYKLQNCVRNYGGVEAKGVLISAFPLSHEATRRRLASAANLTSASGSEVTRLLTGDLLMSPIRGANLFDRA
ncbi:MAG: ATP-binding protein [Pirellulales bacterium]